MTFCWTIVKSAVLYMIVHAKATHLCIHLLADFILIFKETRFWVYSSCKKLYELLEIRN